MRGKSLGVVIVITIVLLVMLRQISSSNLSVSSRQQCYYVNAVTLHCSGSLPKLDGLNIHSLALENCDYDFLKNNTFERTNKVKLLSIACNYADNRSLHLENGVFGALHDLAQISMKNNNFESLPNGLFCLNHSITTLTLSNNRFKRITNLGFESYCSYDNQFGCSFVKELSLESNRIEVVDDNSFCNFRYLVSLNLSSNAINTIHRNAFSRLLFLKFIDLSNNNLTTLPISVFETERMSSSLLDINLSHNYLNSSVFIIFSNLSNLRNLDLSSNQIEILNISALCDCTAMMSLKLRENNIKHIPEKAFLCLKNLEELDLSRNHITTIKHESFRGLNNILKLYLSHNFICTIESNSFTSLSSIEVLNLSHNKIKTLQNTNPLFKYAYPRKKFVFDASFNKIRQIENTSFINNSGSYYWYVNLAHNLIENVDPTSFRSEIYIVSLDLSHNKLNNITGVFRDCFYVENLDVSFNELTEFSYKNLPGLFGKLTMNASHNAIAFTREDEQSLSYDEIQKIVKILDLSYNKLSTVSFIPRFVEIVLLNNNAISYFKYPGPFRLCENLQELDLRNNLLKELCESWFQMSSYRNRLLRTKILLSGNPLRCTCQMTWLKYRFYANYETINLPLIIDSNSLQCQPEYLNEIHRYRPMKLSTMFHEYSNEFVCKATHNYTNTCSCNDDMMITHPEICHLTCPLNCSCFRDFNRTFVIINCSRAGWDDINDDFLNYSASETVTLHLDGNNITQLRSSSLGKFKNLLVLYLNNSRVIKIQEYAFNDTKYLQVLFLNSNRLRSLSRQTFFGLSKLRKLFLNSNHLEHIDSLTFNTLSSLRELYLNDNNLKDFPVWNLRLLPSLEIVSLADNFWSCDCGYFKNLLPWFENYSNIITDVKNLACVLDGSSLSFLAYNDSRCMNTNSFTILNDNHLGVYVTLGCALLIIIIIIMLAFVYRRDVQALVYSWYGIRLFSHDDDVYKGGINEKVYDAFICYNSKDEIFVMEQIIPGLENIQNPYKLCLHHRDFPVGSFISESIYEAVEKSKRTILIFTQNFVDSNWCRFEFKVAHLQTMKDSNCKIILIFCEEMPSNMDEEMNFFVKYNTYLVWNERLFWKKLYFSLPEKQTTSVAA